MVPVSANVETNSTLSNESSQNKNENSTTTENDVTETDNTTQSNESRQSTCANDTIKEPQTFEDSIKIRLKYLNDNCRLVEGRLQENIGVFKRYSKILYITCT